MLVNKKEKLNKKRQQILDFLKSRRGKALLAVCVLVLVLYGCVSRWNRGALIREGIAFCEKGEYAEAQTCFKNAVIADNMDPDNYNYLGIAYLGSGHYEDAAKQFQLALNLDNESEEAYRGLGIIALKGENYSVAVDYFNQALEYSGLNIKNREYDILWYRADAEKALEDYEAAIQTYSALLELEGDTALIRYSRGSMYCILGQKEQAMEDFDAAVKKKGNGYELFWNIYDRMAEAGWTEEGRDYLELTKQPGYVDSKENGSEEESRKYQGIIEYICGNYDEAIHCLSGDALKKDEQAQIYQALSYEKKEDYAKALSIYLEQVNDAGANASDYNRIARYLIRRENGKQAVDYLKQGIKDFAEDDLQELYYNLVSAYESDGSYAKAEEALQKYISLYGEDEETAREMAFLKERRRKNGR